MRYFVACDRNGEPFATIKAESEKDADKLGLRKLPGFHHVLEVRSHDRREVERALYKAFIENGYSPTAAKTASIRRNVLTLHSYETKAAITEAWTSRRKRHRNDPYVDDIQTAWDDALLPDEMFEESFREMGLKEFVAKAAAKGRRK